jgi:uncharacterized protein (TIGR02246 family)
MTDALESRLRAVEDELAVNRLVNKYFTLADRFDWKSWSELFSPEGVFVTPGTSDELKGPANIHEGVSARLTGAFHASQHYITNLEIEVSGDTATAHGEMIFAAVKDGTAPNRYLMMGGRYNWALERIDGRWSIKKAWNSFVWNNMPDDPAS